MVKLGTEMTSGTDNLPDAWNQALRLQLEKEETVLNAVEIDLDARLHFARGIVVLTERRLLTKQAGSVEWQSWKLEKNVHPHTLRHSFATHLIEEGNHMQIVQGLLGHKSIDTTMVYVHLVRPDMLKVKSPLDSLEALEKED